MGLHITRTRRWTWCPWRKRRWTWVEPGKGDLEHATSPVSLSYHSNLYLVTAVHSCRNRRSPKQDWHCSTATPVWSELMPAARSLKKGQNAVNFRSLKRNVTKKSPKKAKKAQRGTAPAEPPYVPIFSQLSLISKPQDGIVCSRIPHLCDFSPLESDIDSVTDDDDFEPLETPGGKLDESRYEAYHRSLKSMRGTARPSQSRCMPLS